ncbi:chemotaxis protein CheW [Teichococcus oryzae]|uniref:Chemotaxis protein CheW n=1 Tax=Teichococcus oryzae TaxID=1608942 RepID=A0A5B2TEK5_9PROT|nr:chemotaxis protein CheW [Pseudoroseomonas oryzae]KAA2212589.1 chemotaxis protein CheW [Pseudoroseomonas oryzae]
MLFLLFHIGDDPYVLEAGCITEVLPLVRIKARPGPSGRIGVINHHGTPVPVIDLSELILGRPSRTQLSTRIALIRNEVAGGQPQWLGLVLEQATEALRLDPGRFASPGFTDGAASYLGPVLADQRGLIQWIHPAKLFSCAAGLAAMPEPVGSA